MARELQGNVSVELSGTARMNDVIEAGARRADDELLLAIVHDARFHIRRSLTRAQMLEKQAEALRAPELRAHMEEILAAGRDLNTLLGRLAKYALAGSAANEQPCGDVGVLFDSALRRLDGKNADAEIEAHLFRSCGIQTPCAIESVLGELLDNALKFRRGPVRITLSAEHSDDKYVFGIKDTGIGFDSQFCERIMRPLERLHPIDVYPGCGLGLAICKRTIEACGGKLWAEAKLGEGSAFWFSLPVSG